jgi:CBS-domain-containing membrane protein
MSRRIVMHHIVRDFMSSKLVYLLEGDHVELALQPILDFGITAVPILDEDHRPVGVVSLRDLANSKRRGERVSAPVEKIGIHEPIAIAALRLTDADVHHLVVVDVDGRAAGMISALDVVRALIGVAPKHPRAIEISRAAETMATKS